MELCGVVCRYSFYCNALSLSSAIEDSLVLIAFLSLPNRVKGNMMCVVPTVMANELRFPFRWFAGNVVCTHVLCIGRERYC